MSRHIIITSCTKNKSTQFKPDGHSVFPSDYLAHPASIKQLDATRSAVFSRINSAYDPSAAQHYAFDLYVREPRTQLYKGMRQIAVDLTVREKLLSAGSDVEWYFLSGGYGLLHAMEVARPYQATFDSSIARNNSIPCTLREWRPILPHLLDEVFSRGAPSSVSVFGSKAYVDMVRATDLYRYRPNLFYMMEGRANKPEVTGALVDTVRRLFKA